MEIYFNACDFTQHTFFLSRLVTIVVFKWSNNISWLLLAELFFLSLVWNNFLWKQKFFVLQMFSKSTKRRMRARASQCLCNVHAYDCYSKLKIEHGTKPFPKKSSSKTFTQNVLNGKTTKMQNLCNLKRTWKSFCLVVFGAVIVVVIRKNPNVNSNY